MQNITKILTKIKSQPSFHSICGWG